MSPDEIERTVQFLLHQQAQFATDFEKLSEKTDRLAEGMSRLTDGLVGLTVIVGRVSENVGQLASMHERHLREDHGYPPA
jgi:flagellar motor switch/type III secretory pathway protein FliN